MNSIWFFVSIMLLGCCTRCIVCVNYRVEWENQRSECAVVIVTWAEHASPRWEDFRKSPECYVSNISWLPLALLFTVSWSFRVTFKLKKKLGWSVRIVASCLGWKSRERYVYWSFFCIFLAGLLNVSRILRIVNWF